MHEGLHIHSYLMPKAMVASQKAYMAHTTHRSTYVLPTLVGFEAYENIVSYSKGWVIRLLDAKILGT